MNRLTRAQAREVDRLAAERFRMPPILLMENAARGAADVAEEMLIDTRDDALAVTLCGGGNNGGDGLAIARHLHNRGRRVIVALTVEAHKYHGDALTNWTIVQAMNLPIIPADPGHLLKLQPSLWIDAVFCTGLTTPPRAGFGALAELVKASGLPVLAVDLPSGMDCDTGQPLGACIAATRTVTFVAEKAGFAHRRAKMWTGIITVADIGCPPEAIAWARASQ